MATADEGVLPRKDAETHDLAEDFYKNLVPLEQVLAVLRFDRATFYRRVEAGDLSKVKVGRHIYVPLQSLQDFREDLINKANEAAVRRQRARKLRRSGQ